jgi:Uma2 family endonuclease
VTESARRRATRADLEALPANVAAEVIGGVLYTFPRPRSRHQNAGAGLITNIRDPFQSGRGGPGGWWILIEPGIELLEHDIVEVAPDVAGWRRERMPELPEGPITIAPDWVCEVLSPSTRAHDQRIKRPLYAKAGVQHLWFIDVDARTLAASRLEGGRWLELGVWGDDDVARIEPFEAIELRVADLWP